MANLRVRIKRLEAKQWQDAWEQLCRCVNGRSKEDLEFFCVHGYLPEVPIPGRSVDTSLWREWTWEDYKRTFAGRSVLELERAGFVSFNNNHKPCHEKPPEPQSK